MTGEHKVPSYFAEFISGFFGERGKAWLLELPGLLARYAEEWNLELLPPFAELSFHYVAPVIRADGSPAVLKIGVPEEEGRTGIEFLRLCNGEGAVSLLEADDERCALLMEQAVPGRALALLEDDDAATGIAAEVMCGLWRPAPAHHTFLTLGPWLRALLQMREVPAASSLPEAMLSRAQSLAAELLASMPEERVLHGDLHPDTTA